MITPAPTLAPDFVPDLDESGNPHFTALNQGQQQAVTEVFQFLFSPDKEFNISGPAGTGKTHLMHFIMNHTLREYVDACDLLGLNSVDYEVALCATTNRAAEVLQEATGFPAQTIHSFLGLKVKDNYKTGKQDLIKTQSWKVHSRTLLFIDEGSMIDSDLHSLILQATDRTCKIIYLGDHCQLAPVFETLSPIYRNPRHMVVLTQPMRNSEQPALMTLCNQLRDTVETLRFTPIQEVPGVIDFVDNQGAYDFVHDTFANDEPDARILAYSNVRVQEYNQHIRAIRGYPEAFTPGEKVINNSAIPIPGPSPRMLQIEKELTILTVEPVLETIFADNTDPNSAFDVYQVTCREKGAHYDISMKLPANPDHMRELMKHYAKVKAWPTFFWLKETFPDFRPRDASTVYKAQGSTYETVFLDLTNIGTCKHNDQLARMLYVGASRATTRLVLYGALPRRLFM